MSRFVVCFSGGDILTGAPCPPICIWTGWLFGCSIDVLPRVPFNFSENVFAFFCAIYSVSWVPCLSLSRFIFLLKWSTPSSSFLRKDACGVQFLVLKNVTYFQHLYSVLYLTVFTDKEFQVKLFRILKALPPLFSAFQYY